jgi:predicted kinase
MLIAMAGLPGTGKSTLAARLAEELNGVVLSKDVVRAGLFPTPVLDYSTAQDDLVMEAIFQAAGYVLHADPDRAVIIDGRTFLRAYQVNDLLGLAAQRDQPLYILECTCDKTVARQRLDQDLAIARHPAGNRTWHLYKEVKARAEPIAVPHLTLDTGSLSLPECVDRVRDYLMRKWPLIEGIQS